MEDIKNQEVKKIDEQEESSFFNFETIYTTLVFNWKWFVLSLIICLGLAAIYLRYTTPIYQANAKMLIKEEDNYRRGRNSALNTSTLGMMTNSAGIENEMEILSSLSLAEQAVRDLKLYTIYTSEGRVKDMLMYQNQPIDVDIDPAHLDKLSTAINLYIQREGNSFHVTGNYNATDEQSQKAYTIDKTINKLPATLATKAGILTFNSRNAGSLKDGESFKVRIVSPKAMAAKFRSSFNVAQSNKGNSIALLTLRDEIPYRAKDYLRQIVICYNRQANIDKNEIARNTEAFINSRLEKISAELGATEGALESYKKRNRMVNQEMNAAQAMDNANAYDQKLAEANTQVALLNSVQESMGRPGGKYETLPANVGISDPTVNGLINKYNEIALQRNKLKQKELGLNQRQEELARRKQEVDRQQQRIDNEKKLLEIKQADLDKLQLQEREKLEELSGLTAEEAKRRLVESLKDEAKTDAASYINEIMDEAKLNANQEAKKIVIQTIQRVATETAIENSVSVFHIDNDEVKGRIIGREGRNIRALEAATGVEIVVDDTPEAIVISAFDPVRREICRLALHQLVADGRIHPARIEEVVAKVKKQLDNEIIETGKRTVIDLGIHGLHPELVRIVGKMKYRSSYGQNLLQHARETANLCAVMAAELGLNPKKAKRAGLLHDIGKVPDEESELPHALYGGKIAEKFKEKPEIVNAIAAHHDEVEMQTLLAPIVQVCDAISGARPGARREIVEAYIKRLNDLEAIAMSYPGVTKTYAIQAGRELRVIVGADKMDDAETLKLSDEIATKIQNEMTYPGQVKITVIRETRSVAYAK